MERGRPATRLTIDPNTGEFSGTPTTPGDYAVELTVDDSQPTSVMTVCPTITIAEQLQVDEAGLMNDGYCIVAGGKTILDYLSGGDGTPIACSTPGGSGDGTLPEGLAVDPQTCKITGSLTETRYGGWAWIVTAEQSGVNVHVPYCATQPVQTPSAYTIVGSHGGKLDNELEPLILELPAEQALRFDGDADPLFEVTKEVCGNSCFFSFLYRVSPSPFGKGPCERDKDTCFGLCPLVEDPNQLDGDTAIGCSLLPKMDNPKTGFAHEMWAKGEVLSDEFTARPFVLQWSLDYCLSDVQADCNGAENILANGDGTNLEFPVIVRPK